MGRIRDLQISTFLWLAILFLVGCLVPPALVFWWAVDSKPPVVALTPRFAGWHPVAPNTVVVEWTGIRNRRCAAVSQRWLVGDRVWELPPAAVPDAEVPEPSPGPTKWKVAVPLPADALGPEHQPLRYRVTFVFACNPLHKVWPITVTAPDLRLPPPGAPADPGVSVETDIPPGSAETVVPPPAPGLPEGMSP